MGDIQYYNGQFIESGSLALPIEERGHQFGDGVYEVVRVYAGRPFLLEWHLERLERSLQVLSIPNLISRADWVSLIHEGIRQSGEPEASVYWQVTRGQAVRNHTFPEHAAPVISMTVRALKPKSVSAETSLYALPDDRWVNAFVKSINLLPNVLAKETAHRHGAVEALYVRNGLALEGGGSNVFFVRNQQLYTAPANRYILPGITRRFVLALAEQLRIPVQEEATSLDDFSTVTEVFVTSTTMEIVPIHRIGTSSLILQALQSLPEAAPASLVVEEPEDYTLWTRPSQETGPITQQLKEAFAERVSSFRDLEPLFPHP